MSGPIRIAARVYHDSDKPLSERYRFLLEAADEATKQCSLLETYERMLKLRKIVAAQKGIDDQEPSAS